MSDTGTFFDRAETLNELVFQALGAASMCWETPEGAGVFDSTRAKAIGDEVVARLRARENEPRLGCATTRQLLDEITTRIEIDGYNGGSGLDYRTVGEPRGGFWWLTPTHESP